MKKVIFIGGMGGSKIDSYALKNILRGSDILYFKYDNTLTKTIEKIAEDLSKFIKNLKLDRNEKVSIVSFSAGGIIAEYYLKLIDDKKIDKVITVCSPLLGTWLPLIFSKKRKGLQQLKRNSKLLKKIRTKKLRNISEKNFWCYLDPLVPGKSGRGDNPKHILFPLHWIIQFWPPLMYNIKNFLEN